MISAVACLVSCGSDPAGDEVKDRCGDADCGASESASSCPADCPSVCGDGACTDDESASTCSVDCAAKCGDRFCSDEESAMICPADCQAACGDGACTHGETAASCSQDCPSVCGDQACTGTEAPSTCPADCPAVCGDTMCTAGESATSCATDCPAGCGDAACTHAESYTTCPQDCPSVCNDGVCASGETCNSCSADCGTCLPQWIEITLVGALIRPAMIDGRSWDGPDLTQSQIDEMATLGTLLVGYPQYDEVAAFLAELAINAYAPPDPFGTAELALTGTFDGTNRIWLAATDENAEDTVSPDWPGPRGWRYVPTSSSMRVRVILADEDLVNDDPIGTVELNESDLRSAWNAQGVVGVPVYMQGVGHVLYLTLSVTQSTAPPVCGGACDAGLYTPCTCDSDDPCGWSEDGVCDSYCSMNYPVDHFDDFPDCAAACSADCQAGTYSACSCSSADPCNWQGDNVCDAVCASNFPSDYFNDSADCP